MADFVVFDDPPKIGAANAPRDAMSLKKRRTGQTEKNVSGGWTLKGVPSETICMTRKAAEHRGMRIGSWVAQTLREAANRELGQPIIGDPNNEILEKLDQFANSLMKDMRSISAQTQALDQELSLIRRGLIPHIVRDEK